jgi:hypothetical protein
MNDNQGAACGAKLSGADATNDLRLAAARKRLAESRGQDDALEGLREIVANFLGSEEVGLFRIDGSGETFHIFWSFGIDPEKYDLLLALGDAGLRRVMGGECHVELAARDQSGTMAKVQAFVPIRLANRTIAILAILRLLPQKHGFDGSDKDLFKLLSNEAALPLFGAGVDGQLPDEHSTDEHSTDEPGMRA